MLVFSNQKSSLSFLNLWSECEEKKQKFVDILVACIFSSEMKHCIKHSTKVFCATKIEKLSIPTSIVQYKQLMGRAKDCLLLVSYMMLIKYVFCITSINTLLDCIKSSIDTPTLW